LVVTTAFSALAPLSWFVLAKGHSYIHRHMNYVLWHMPFTLIGFVMCGFFVSLMVKRVSEGRTNNWFKKRTMAFIGIFVVAVVLIIVLLQNRNQLNDVTDIINNSEKLVENEYCDIYLYNDYSKLTYVCNSNVIADAKFYLHLYPLSGSDVLPSNRKEYGYDNLDFMMDEYAVSSRYKGKSVIVRDLPGYGLNKINTGQFKGEEILWSDSLQLKVTFDNMNSIEISDLTDSNWNKGVLRLDKRVILFDYSIQAEASLQQASGVTIDGTYYELLEVKIENKDWINVVLDKEKVDGTSTVQIEY